MTPSKTTKKSRTFLKWGLASLGLLVILAFVATALYLGDYYKADFDVSGYRLASLQNQGIETRVNGRFTVLTPPAALNNGQGIIFYPGGKVEADAYLPLVSQLSAKGFTTVLVKMPFRLAVLDANAALDAFELAPDVKGWYLAGHSLGGAMASSLMEKHQDQFKGLILLAAYPLNDATLPTLALYGANDTVLSEREALKKATRLVEIEGGNHAQFGNYGPQEGDGLATISQEAQQQFTVDQITGWINP